MRIFMKNRLGKNKKVGSISIIEGHDGPTSFFIAGRKI